MFVGLAERRLWRCLGSAKNFKLPRIRLRAPKPPICSASCAIDYISGVGFQGQIEKLLKPLIQGTLSARLPLGRRPCLMPRDPWDFGSSGLRAMTRRPASDPALSLRINAARRNT